MPASTSTPVLKPDTQLLPEAMPASGATPDDSLEDGEITEDETVVPTSPPPSPTAPKPKQSTSLPNPSPPFQMFTSLLNTVTPHELTLAKDLVLDLLGWGVTPEYLLDVGVSGQALHRIFSDLRLRMPRTMCIGGGGGAGVDEGGVARRAGYGCEIDRGGVGGRADGR
jgi:hypothetical protein